MNLHDLLSNPQLRHREFPVSAEGIFLGHSSSGPLPRRVAQVLRDYADEFTTQWQGKPSIWGRYQQARIAAARFLDVTQEEVAFIASTAHGLGIIAEGVTWRPGDRVLVQENDFPANVFPWLRLRERGVAVDEAPYPEDGRITWETIAASLRPETRLVTLSAVHYLTGHRPNLEEIGRNLRERGILFCVDAIQGLGPVSVPAAACDFLVAGGQKWLLSPMGSGLLYVRREILDQVEPVPLGWQSVENWFDFINPGTRPLPEAGRFELGTPSVLMAMALAASLELHLELGREAIWERVRHLHDRTVAAVRERDYNLLGPHEPGETSGIVSFSVPGADGEALCQQLERDTSAGPPVYCTARADFEGTTRLRFAPYFTTTDEDLERAFVKLDLLTGRSLGRDSPGGRSAPV